MSNGEHFEEDHEDEESENEEFGSEQMDEQPMLLNGEEIADLELQDNEQREEKPPADDSIGKFKAHQKDVFCMTLSPNGRWLASGSEDDTAAVWDLEHQSPEPHLRIIGKHMDSVHCLAWNSTGNVLATGDMAGRIVCTPLNNSQDSSFIIQDCQISTSSEEDQAEENSFEQLRWILWHPSAEGILFAGSGDGLIWMWLISGKAEQPLLIQQSKIFTTNSNAPCVAGQLLADTKYLIAAYEDSMARLWNLKEANSSEVSLPGPCTGAMDLNTKAGLAAIGCSNGVTALLGTQFGLKPLHVFASPKNENSTESNNGTSDDNEVENGNSIECVRFSPGDLPWLAVGTAGGHLTIFDWEHRSSRYECEHDDEAVVNCIWRVGPNNSISLISACIDSGIRIWDARSGEPLTLFSGGGDEIFSLTKWESAEGRSLLLTGCAGGLIRIFQLPANL